MHKRILVTASSAIASGLIAASAMVSLSSSNSAEASSYRLIYRFQGVPDARGPNSGLVADGEGRLYGETFGGGQLDAGAVYRLTKPAAGAGSWTEEVLHSFDFSDGTAPDAPLLLGASGEVYGTTTGGGTSGLGVIFRLDNAPGWPITLLHQFGPQPDGLAPNSNGLSFGPDGLLYGVTLGGGFKRQSFRLGQGVAYSISPLGDQVEYEIIHDFGKGTDGYIPLGLAVSSTGRLFGVTQDGGVNGQGMAFSLQRNASGVWKESRLTQFAAPGLHGPTSPPFLGRATLGHDLYGCGPGGVNQLGVVYRLSPPPDGGTGWTQTILYNFGATPGDATYTGVDTCGLTQGPDGKLYGTTSFGGATNSGAFFEVDPPAPGSTEWTETVLYSFNAIGDRGYNPIGNPLRQGNKFYGIAGSTSSGFGAVYELTP